MHFRNIPQGQSKSKHFLVYNTGRNKLEIGEPRIEWCGSRTKSQQPNVEIQFDRVGNERANLLRKLNVKSGDYLVRVHVLPDYECLPGELSGRLFVSTNLQGDLEQVTVDIHGTIVGDICVGPEALILTSGEETSPPVEFKLLSLSGKPFNVTKVLAEGDISIREFDLTNKKAGLCVRVFFDEPESKDAATVGSIVFHMDNKNVLKVPVVMNNS